MLHDLERRHKAPTIDQRTPEQRPYPMKPLLVTFAGLLAFFYLLNPTFGVFEFIPDNIPLLGNLDEATATMVLLGALRYHGWDFTRMFTRYRPVDFGKAV